MSQYQLILVGYSHKNAPVDFRDRISLDRNSALTFVQTAMEEASFIKEIAIISTCNRTEFYFVAASPNQLRQWLIDHYQSIRGITINFDEYDPVILFDEEVVTHVLRVAGGLESMMLGENQILAQVRLSYDLILSSGNHFPILNRLFQDAIRAGKAIRTRTTLCKGPVSVGLAAVELARKIFANFKERKILLIGAGQTSALVAVHFRELGASRFIVANRGIKRRLNLASKLDAQALSLEEIPSALTEVDIVIAATKSEKFLVSFDDVMKVMKVRNYRPLLIVDISTPRSVDPKVANIAEVFLYNIDHLQNIIGDNLDKRRREIPAAEAIISEIGNEYFSWLQNREVVPTITQLVNYFDRIRTQEVEKFVHRTTEKEYQHMNQLAKSITRKLLHYPISYLRDMTNGDSLDPMKINVVWDLFRLHDNEKDSK